MGGAERNLAQVADKLQLQGLLQHVVSVGDGGVWGDWLSARGIGVSTLRATNILHAPWAVSRLSSLIRQLQPAVIQGWMYHGDLFAALAHRITPARKDRRLFWNLRASNTDQGGYRSIVAINARLSAWPDLIIANSKVGVDFHLAQGYRPRRVEIIPNGIDIEKFQADAAIRKKARADLGIPTEALVAIHVARVDPMKDHGSFLRAMASLPQLRGLLVGAGTETLATPSNVQALGLCRDVEQYYAASDIVVSTSAFAEGFSNVLAEGMSAGLIPVTTEVGDARLIVGESGFVVPPRSPEAIAAAIGQVAELSPADRRSRAQQARQRIVDNFSLERTVGRFAGLYSSA
jgi:glycosyltransferase involved in cell wall biosynthesis